MSKIQVDIWGGDLHQALVDSKEFESWIDALGCIQTMVDAGLLVNVLATDFKAPDFRQSEVSSTMLALATDWLAQK